MSRAPNRRTAVEGKATRSAEGSERRRWARDGSPTDISDSFPGLVVLWPTEAPAETPPGPLLAEKAKAREVKKAGAMKAPSPAAMRATERICSVLPVS